MLIRYTTTMKPAIPENEARNLINSMNTVETSQISKESEDEGEYCSHDENLTLLEIQNSMRIESAEQDKYLDIICDLLDESIRYNDSKKVMSANIAVCLEQGTDIGRSRRKSPNRFIGGNK